MVPLLGLRAFGTSWRKFPGPVTMYLPLGMMQHVRVSGWFLQKVCLLKFWSLVSEHFIGHKWSNCKIDCRRFAGFDRLRIACVESC